MNKLGLIGWPCGHSLSPKLFAMLGRKIHFPLSYRAIPVRPETLVNQARRLQTSHYRGLNVTIPHKQSIIGILDSMTREAREIGAVNVLSFARGEVLGHNTDAAGFLDALRREGFDPKDRAVVIFGAGGSARAVGWALGKARARKVRFVARRPGQAQELAKTMRFCFPATKYSAGAAAPADLWVNATPLGMKGYPDRAQAASARCKAALDLVYARRTLFLRKAEAAGARVSDGRAMLVFQALRSWEFWFKPLGAARRRRLGDEIIKELSWV